VKLTPSWRTIPFPEALDLAQSTNRPPPWLAAVGIALVAAHTNLDAPLGNQYRLAQRAA
jgi:hypothetical protein